MMEKFIKEKLTESAEVKKRVAENLVKEIIEIAEVIIKCYNEGGKVVLFGNGGSAADAQHIAAELISRFKCERPSLAAIALTTNTSIITAIGNDYDFSKIFERQIEGIVTNRDVVIGISTSGNSPNVIKGIKKAESMGAKTIAFAGEDCGKLGEMADYTLKIPSNDTPRIQEAHITIGHILCELIERELFCNE